jgi:hypothetical protein
MLAYCFARIRDRDRQRAIEKPVPGRCRAAR